MFFRGYFRQKPIGRVFSKIDCRLSDNIVRRPDLSVFLRAIDLRVSPVPFAPDIVIEVLSASESAIDVNRKSLQYLAAGSLEVWQVDYENAQVFIRTKDDIRRLRGETALETPLLPGFSAPVSTLLAGF